jgi:tRNA threonylcarbamoyladenosine biosynthesis protein TsaE
LIAGAYFTATEEETIALGRRLAALLPRPCVVLLIGDLGAGKTTLTKGLAHGAAPPDDVSSPTFPLIHEYGDPVEMYHIDLYRLDSWEQVRTLGIEELYGRHALVVMEWAERFPQLLPAARVEIRIQARDDESRRVDVTELS